LMSNMLAYFVNIRAAGCLTLKMPAPAAWLPGSSYRLDTKWRIIRSHRLECSTGDYRYSSKTSGDKPSGRIQCNDFLLYVTRCQINHYRTGGKIWCTQVFWHAITLG
jgi:hypothetical protein